MGIGLSVPGVKESKIMDLSTEIVQCKKFVKRVVRGYEINGDEFNTYRDKMSKILSDKFLLSSYVLRLNAKMNIKKHDGTVSGTVLVVAMAVVIILPLILEYAVFRNNMYSAISNGDWANFLGSYAGGCVGLFGAIWVVYESNRANREIRYENELTRQRERREDFATKIIECVARYIANISVYFYDNVLVERLCYEKNNLPKPITEEGKEEYEKRCSELNAKISKYSPDRKIANEYYFLIVGKLLGISEGDELVVQLKIVHDLSASRSSDIIKWSKLHSYEESDVSKIFEEQCRKLEDIATKFKEDYAGG